MIREETIHVSGICCERCVLWFAKTLEGYNGLEAANANLMGHIILAWNKERTSRETIVATLERGSFKPIG